MKLLFDRDREDVEDLIGNTKLEENKNREIITDINKPMNTLIEGDNLLSLNHLLETHTNLVNLIYIDPPYRTQNKNFRYNDYFKTHDEWLSFMEKRLILAKKLLTDDGVIFISIDDNEFAHLKLLCDDIFGEHNHISTIIWESKSGGANDVKLIATTTEYILVYSKDIKNTKFSKQIIDIVDDKKYKYEDEFVAERGKYLLNKLDRTSLGYLESLDFPIEVNGLVGIPGGTLEENSKKIWRWRWGKEKVEWGIKNNFIVAKKDSDGNVSIYSKQYQLVDNEGNRIDRTVSHRNMINNIKTSTSSKEIKDIFNNKAFSYPKPKDLIKQILKYLINKDIIVLDFFAGSGTTGHAVLELNKEDGGNRQFILCTNNENNICEEVTYQRINKVINGYTTPKGKEVEGLGGNLKYYKVVKK